MDYQEIEIVMGTNTVKNIQASLPDGSVLMIPCDPANSDYQRYLRWLENPDAESEIPSVTP